MLTWLTLVNMVNIAAFGLGTMDRDEMVVNLERLICAVDFKTNDKQSGSYNISRILLLSFCCKLVFVALAC